MTQNLRKVAVAAGLAALAVASSANAAVANQNSYTWDFKTFYDTSTIANTFDTKTLNYSVASLTIANISGGVQVTLKQNSTLFPSSSSAGTLLDSLWLNGTWGTVAGGGVTGGGTFLGLPTIFKDGGYVYNGSINLPSTGLTEGSTATFTIKGNGVTAYNFAKSSNVPFIELSRVGGEYNPLGGLLTQGKVSFIGTLPAAIPEPSTYALMGLGLAGVALASRRAAARRAA